VVANVLLGGYKGVLVYTMGLLGDTERF